MKRYLMMGMAILFLFSMFAVAQEQTGELVGTVTDEEGNPLPGVSVTADSPSLMGTASSVTNMDGDYRLLRLPPGTYTVTYEMQGFGTLRREGIVIRLGRTFSLDVTLRPAALEEEVTVVGQSPVVDVKKSSTTYEISKEMFSKLPRGRDFESIITVASGVNEESELLGISFDGASSSENMFYIDGVDTTTMYDGVSGQNVMFEFVEEVQVKSSGYEAQYGGSMGGVVNVVTRAGGNEFSGEVMTYYRSSSLTGEPRPSLRINPYDVTKAEYITYPKDSWNQFEIGFVLGGYLIKDRMWFFGSYIPRFTITNRDVDFLTDPDASGQFTRSNQWHNASFKLTLQPMKGMRMSGSFNTDYYQWRGSLPSQAGTSPSDYNYAAAGYNYPGMTGAFHADYIVSDDFFFTASAGAFRTNVESMVGPPGERYYFYRSNSGIPGVPADQVRPQYWYNYPVGDAYQLLRDIQTKYTAKLDATYFMELAGEHMWKVGFQFNRIGQDVFDAAPYDLWYFWWGENYESPNLGTVETKYGYMAAYDPLGTVAEINSNRMAIYLQDAWTLSRKLTVNAGIRMEKEDIPSFVDPNSQIAQEHPEFTEPPIAFDFTDKIAPRIGFSYDVNGDGSFKVFGSYGIYYDVMKLDMAEGSYGGFKWLAHYYEIPDFLVENWSALGERDHPDTSLPYYETLNWRIPSYETTQPDMEPYSKAEYTLGIQRRLTEDFSLSVRFLHNRIIWAIEDIGIQTKAGEQYFNGNPGSDWINDIYAESAAAGLMPSGVKCPRAKRQYYSVDVGFDKRFSDNWLGGLHYTWSRLWGNFAGLASSEEHGRKDPNVERYFDAWFLHYTSSYPEESTGPLATDRPHQFKVYGAYSFDFGLTVGVNAYAYTGTPVTREFELNNQDGYYPEGRFTDGRTPFLWYGDAYMEYNIQVAENNAVQFNININNVTNNRIAQRIYNQHNLSTVYMDDMDIYNGFDYRQVMAEKGTTLNPLFLKEYAFQSPIQVRIGVKFIF
ncbi:MAG: carboxypeptidase regulatory-like domain-containing protein [Candidatus Aminicenantes bacterium]